MKRKRTHIGNCHSHAHWGFQIAPNRLCECQKPSKSQYYTAQYSDRGFCSTPQPPSQTPSNQLADYQSHSYIQDSAHVAPISSFLHKTKLNSSLFQQTHLKKKQILETMLPHTYINTHTCVPMCVYKDRYFSDRY